MIFFFCICRQGNIVVQAPAGSGKTAAIAVGLLSNVEDLGAGVQGICLCHSRELAIQNFRYIRKVAERTKIKVAIAIPEYHEKDTKKSEEDLEPHSLFYFIDYYIVFFDCLLIILF